MFTQIAWRNVWRNPRRTGVIMIAIIVGIWSMIFFGALMRGIEMQMIQNGISTLTGNIQIHQLAYREDPSIDNSMQDPNFIFKALKDVLPFNAKWAPRIRVNAIASNAHHSTGITLIGIDPDKESGLSFLEKSISKGTYNLSNNPRGIIVGQALLEKFETRIGRKIILMSQDVNQEIASKSFRISGIFRAEMEQTEKQFVFVNLASAQKMLKLDDQLSEIAISIPTLSTSATEENTIIQKLQQKLSTNQYEILSWHDLLPMLNAYLKIFDGFISIWFLVVFIAMGFGIINTTLMAVFERMREFGLLKALGMKPKWIVQQVLYEVFYIILIGGIIGNGLALATIFIFSKTGIDLSRMAAGVEMWGMSRIIYPTVTIWDIILANFVVFGLGLFVSLYPAIKAARFTPVEALMHN